jgi:hypothetical protein
MRRMLPLVITLVLVLAPAAWGYIVTPIVSPDNPLYGIDLYANLANTPTGTIIGARTDQPVSDPNPLFAGTNIQYQATNGNPPTTPYDQATSQWIAKVYQPVETWDPSGVGKTTTITQVINASLLIKIMTSQFIMGSGGHYFDLVTGLTAVREDPAHDPIVTLDVSWSASNLSQLYGAHTSFTWLDQSGFFPSFQDILAQKNYGSLMGAGSDTQTVGATGMSVLLAHNGDFYLMLKLDADGSLNGLLLQQGGELDFSNNIFLTETLSFYEPDLVNPNPEPVPVPPSLVLFGSGLLGLGFFRRRRRQG